MTNIREKKSVLLYSEKSQPYGYRNVIYVLKKKKARKEDYVASLEWLQDICYQSLCWKVMAIPTGLPFTELVFKK